MMEDGNCVEEGFTRVFPLQLRGPNLQLEQRYRGREESRIAGTKALVWEKTRRN